MAYEEELREIFGDEKECHRMMLPYRIAIETVKTKLETLDDEMKCTFEHSPIHNIKSRVKTPESIIEKLHRKNLEVSINGLRQLTDISGVRVICRYVDDIFYVAQLLLLHDDISLVRKTNYIQYPKENGYRSLHLIVNVPVYRKEGVQLVPVEIQIRTIAMDMWASLEHDLHYKATHEVSDNINQRLKKCAEDIAATDLEMQNIYRELNSKWKQE
jgi:Uncharacterized protein conserved in bacteria